MQRWLFCTLLRQPSLSGFGPVKVALGCNAGTEPFSSRLVIGFILDAVRDPHTVLVALLVTKAGPLRNTHCTSTL